MLSVIRRQKYIYIFKMLEKKHAMKRSKNKKNYLVNVRLVLMT